MQGGRGFREILGLMEGLQSPVSPSASLMKQGLYFIFKLHTEGKALWMFNIFIHSSINILGWKLNGKQSFFNTQLGEANRQWLYTWWSGELWGTHVHLWGIHVDVWQNQYNIVK